MRKPRPWSIPLGSLTPGRNRLEFDLAIEDIGGERHEVAENPSFETLIGPVKVELDIVRRGRRLLVSGRVRFRARMRCALCGVEYERDYDESLATEFVAEGEVPPPDGKVMVNRDVEEFQFKDDFLELGPLVHDTIHLAIPIAPRCGPGCKGACPRCGKSLNDGPCDCAPESDSPFAELVRLRDEERSG